MKVFTAAQMREFDRRATEEYCIPSIVLMENAALRVVEFLEMKFAPLKDKRIVILCGKGNNGGDGFAIARHFVASGYSCIVLLTTGSENLQGDAQINHSALRAAKGMAYQLHVHRLDMVTEPSRAGSPGIANAIDILWEADIVVDALLGTGFIDKVGNSPLANALEILWVYTAGGAGSIARNLVAVDIASALNSDTGEAAHKSVRADFTITFAAPKRGMFLRDGIEKCGEIWVGSIGTPPQLMEKSQTGCECITREIANSLLPRRAQDAHKGDAGRVLLIGGSYGMSGAPTLAARAALKSGAGLCIAALPDKIISTFAATFSEATSHPLPCNEAGVLIEESADELPALWKNVNAVAIGPGIGRDASTLNFVRRIVRECPQPLIIDADALFALREIEADLKNRKADTILTPHPGEMAELMKMSTSDVNDNRIETAIACAQKYNAIVVLKGARSIVALPDGSTHINLTGNSGMATGGSGDVLTGTIAGLLAQNKNAQTATMLGVYLHGMAGDLAFETSGNGLIAGDIADNIPRALVELAKPIEPPTNARLRKLE